MMPQTIFFFFKQVNYLYQHNNSTHAAFIERNELQQNAKWKKKERKTETETETFLL
jgi:hypothetical protein